MSRPSHQPEAVVITCSDRVSSGTMADLSGPDVVSYLRSRGYDCADAVVVPDDIDAIEAALVAAVRTPEVRFVVTVGGTGISARDVTPEATARIGDRLIPGFGELMRDRSLEKTSMAPLSRAGGWAAGDSLIINVPGSRAGAIDNLEAVIELVPHALDLLAGKTPHEE